MHKNVNRFSRFVVLVSLPLILTALPAKSSPDLTSGTNVFSPPADEKNEVPTFTEDKGPNARIRKLLLGDQDGLPKFQQVRTIPSLSPQQRKAIRQIYTDARTQMQPLQEQLKGLRDKYGGGRAANGNNRKNKGEDDRQSGDIANNGNSVGHSSNSNNRSDSHDSNSSGNSGNGSSYGSNNKDPLVPDAQARETFQQLRAQIRDLHQQTWQKVKALLSDKQLQEMEAMRHGEMTPPTFNAPMTGAGGQRQVWQQQAQKTE